MLPPVSIAWRALPVAVCLLGAAAWVGAPERGPEHGSSLGPEAEGRPSASAQAVTYAEDVAPILTRSCVSCHSPVGSAPFALGTYEDARPRAERIAEAVERGAMPPWLPEAEPGTFEGERLLSPGEVEVLRAWADEGAPPGDLARAAAAEAPEAWDPGPADLVLELPTFRAEASGDDVYRNLVVPIPVSETKWVEYVELRPGSGSAVHHARMMVDTTSSSRALDAQDEEPGFDGMELLSFAADPDGHFVGWTPGKSRLPPLEGTAWRLEPGTDLVVQVHVQPSGRAEEVSARVALHFADEPPTRHPAILVLSSLLIDIPAGASDYRAVNSFTLPVDVQVLSVYPHAHYLGKDLRATAILPSGREVTLVHIPDWDFDWQDDYRFREPIALPAGTTIVKQYSFDNSADNPHNPASPPRRVVYGSRSTDEMADLILQVLPRSEVDRDELLAAQAWQHEAEDMAYVAHVEYTRGQELLERGNLAEAGRHFREALSYRADHVGALVGLSRILMEQGDAQSAGVVARQAVTMSNGLDPVALEQMARVYAELGRVDDAVRAAEEALRLARSLGDGAMADTLEAAIRAYRARRPPGR